MLSPVASSHIVSLDVSRSPWVQTRFHVRSLIWGWVGSVPLEFCKYETEVGSKETEKHQEMKCKKRHPGKLVVWEAISIIENMKWVRPTITCKVEICSADGSTCPILLLGCFAV